MMIIIIGGKIKGGIVIFRTYYRKALFVPNFPLFFPIKKTHDTPSSILFWLKYALMMLVCIVYILKYNGGR